MFGPSALIKLLNCLISSARLPTADTSTLSNAKMPFVKSLQYGKLTACVQHRWHCGEALMLQGWKTPWTYHVPFLCYVLLLYMNLPNAVDQTQTISHNLIFISWIQTALNILTIADDGDLRCINCTWARTGTNHLSNTHRRPYTCCHTPLILTFYSIVCLTITWSCLRR